MGGGSVTGTLTLSAAAPAGGTSVTLSSSKSFATVPAGVTVAAGQTQATFTVATDVVSATATAVISGTAGGVTKTANLSVKRLEVSSVSLTPASVAGGNTSTGKVTLNGPAPTGGKVVTLASNKGEAAVPASVTVAAGQKTASFTVTTTPVSSPVSATISATLGVSKTKVLTIKPPAVYSVKMAPTSVFGGSSSTGTVTLDAPAPSGGTAVSLASNKAEASVPAGITVPSGQTTATFTANTVVVYANVAATISAAGGGVTKTATLTVKSHWSSPSRSHRPP